jgi:hypothetical protein
MLDRPTNPLDIARAVLLPETIRAVRQGGFTNSAYLILDRWALNNPVALRALEKQGEFSLLRRLDQQQAIEKRTLCSDSAWQASRQGMTDHEILQNAEIETELSTT